MAYEACRISMKYMIPVILLSDGYIANGSEPWKIPDIKSLTPIETNLTKKVDGYEPFNHNKQTLARPWALPGTEGYEHRIGGLEKADITGNVDYSPENHDMMVRQRQKKVDIIAGFIPPLEIYGKDTGDLLVISWGGVFGSVKSGVKKAQEENLSVSHIHLRHLNPFPANLGDCILNFK